MKTSIVLILGFLTLNLWADPEPGTYQAPFEMFQSVQLPNVTLEIGEELAYKLTIDGNGCDFDSKYGFPATCKEGVPLIIEGNLEFSIEEEFLKVFQLPGHDKYRVLVIGSKKFQRVRLVMIDDEGNVSSSRVLNRP